MVWGLMGLMAILLLATSTAHRLAAAPTSARATASPSSPAVKAGYWPSWNNHTFPPSSINLSYFTHVFYAFVQADPATSELVITADDDLMLPNFSATLHAHRPPVKAMLSVGGGGSSPAAFHALVSSPSARSAFISSSIAVARRYGLDGLDLDWEWPENTEQMTELGDLYTEWRDAVNREAVGGDRLLLTSAVYFASHFFLSGEPRSYPAAAISRGLDWVNAMCYDYHGGWNTSETGEHAALYDPRGNLSTSYGVGSWIGAGLPPEKVVMGLPLYGRTWRLKDPADHGVGAPAVRVGPGSSDGVMVYSAVVGFNEAGATVVEDAATVSAYSYAGADWIGYDDPASVAVKIEFARGMGLGGYFFWALGDDYDWSISRTAFVAWGS